MYEQHNYDEQVNIWVEFIYVMILYKPWAAEKSFLLSVLNNSLKPITMSPDFSASNP